LVPLFVFDPEVYSPWEESEADIQWYREVLMSLKSKLRALGSDLMFEIGKAEEVVPRICEELSASTVVTQRETDVVWSGKLDVIAKRIPSGSALSLYTYTLIGQNTGWSYPLSFAETKEWDLSGPVEAVGRIKSPEGASPGRDIPSADDLYDAVVEAWSGFWGEANPIPEASSFPYRSAYCSPEILSKVQGSEFVLSGAHEVVANNLNRYFAAFRGDQPRPESLESLALDLEVPGGFGQSFNVLFRKHLSQGVLSPGEVYLAASSFKANLNPLSALFSASLKGANAAMAEAVKYDFAHNLHQYSLERERMLDAGGDGAVDLSYESWRWRGTHQEFIVGSPSGEQGEGEGKGKKVVLIHGFGAFGEHWRENVVGLVRAGYTVYAPTLCGYGRSEKASAQYTPQLWSLFVRDFITSIVKSPAVLAGNSIGGYISAYTAAKHPGLVKGLVLVNTAGKLVEEVAELPFEEVAIKDEDSGFEAFRKTVVAEVGSRLIFSYLERSVSGLLRKAYPQFPERADAGLAKEIERASSDPGAFDVFKSVFYLPPPTPLSNLLKEYEGPVQVFQGANDPLNDAPARAKQMKELCGVEVQLVEAGHCPHDEVPEAFNDCLEAFYSSLLTL